MANRMPAPQYAGMEMIMKKIGYLLFAWIYNLFCLFTRVRDKKIVLWNGHNYGLNGNLREICRALQRSGEGYQILAFAKRDFFCRRDTGERKALPGLIRGGWLFFVAVPYHMSTAEKIFFNDNFLPLAYMRTGGRKTQLVQLWHGSGAFKRFGLSTEENPEVYETVRRANQRLTHLFVTSRQVMPFYEEAFAVSPDKIYPTGLPATDIYFDEERKQRRRKAFYQKYPELEGRKLLLYAPTFRRTQEENREIMKQFDVERIHRLMGGDWTVLVKLHPKFPMENFTENKYCYNMTHYNDIFDLYLVADLLVTDYSSTVVDYVLLDKPVILFAYDLEKYDRGFYFDYEQLIPGEIAHDKEELYELLQKEYQNFPKRQNFVKFQYDNVSQGACERILEILG